MVPIVSLLLILGASILVTRISAVVLERTGLSPDAARFQARSAFTGVGFTTTEAECVVDHPVRRRVVQWLMLVGNVGTVSAMAALLVSAIDLRTQEGIGLLAALLVGGIALLCVIGSNGWIDRQMCRGIGWAIQRFGSLDPPDYAHLLHLRGSYQVSNLRVDDQHWVAGKTLAGAGLLAEGVVVLGVECPGGEFVGAPGADVEIRAGDQIVVYGRAERLGELSARQRGDAGELAHAAAATERRRRIEEERQQAAR